MSRRRPVCAIRREQDELVCSACGVRWAVGEESPCSRASTVPDEPVTPRAETLEAAVPLELPTELAERMATAYEAAGRGDGSSSGRVAAMRAAWRVFLDSV